MLYLAPLTFNVVHTTFVIRSRIRSRICSCSTCSFVPWAIVGYAIFMRMHINYITWYNRLERPLGEIGGYDILFLALGSFYWSPFTFVCF
jgi:hypothetical protein